MWKRTIGTCLVVAALIAPSAAFAAPQVDRAERQPTWIERVWGELRELVGVAGPDEPRGDEWPRSISAGEDGSQGHDPDG